MPVAVEVESFDPNTTERSWSIAATVAVLTVVAFVLIQVAVHTLGLRKAVPGMATGAWSFRPELVRSALRCAALVGASCWALRRRTPVVAVIPVLAYCLGSVLIRSTSILGQGVPLPIGAEWVGVAGPVWLAWFGAAIDICLVAAPIAATWWCDRRAGVRRLHERRQDRLVTICALCASGFGALLVLNARETVTGIAWRDEAGVFLGLFALGAALSDRRWSSAVVALVAGAVLVASWLVDAPSLLSQAPSVAVMWAWLADNIKSLWPYLAVLVIALMATPLAQLITKVRLASLTSMLVIVNGLNALDAVFTSIFLSGGATAEANPLVRVVGLPAKIGIVAVASVLLSRWRPKA